tara:strand:- start:363 stop:1091 length:729 start_codon:yes stop_codon:yes gene_type:complete
MIIANWKMNGSKELIENWIDFVSHNIDIKQKKECIFCPPSCYLDFAKTLLETRGIEIKLGSQQIDSELSAPLTGGINSQMLIDSGCEFVIIGHSEQRIFHKEDNKILSHRLREAIKKNLKPIFCIGESLQQKEDNKTKDILLEQLKALPTNLEHEFVLAYEPVWAIGTGENADIPYIEEIHSFIKGELCSKTNPKSCIEVVYGGSVNLNNYKEIYSSDKVDGLLIGGASLDSDTFTKIYNMT